MFTKKCLFFCENIIIYGLYFWIPTTYPGQIITLNVEYEVTAEGDYSSKWKMYDRKNNLIYPHKSIGLGVNIMARKK